jgi:arginyl-tRNA synthetase
MIQEKIKNLIRKSIKTLETEEVDFVLEHPSDLKMGDYSSNIAMALAKNLKTNPKDLAQRIVDELNKEKDEQIEKIESAGAGFINFYLSPKYFHQELEKILIDRQNYGRGDLVLGKKVIVEYTQPNPFKPFHIGHLMSNAIGESLSRIVEFQGAQVVHANYQGDVGPHVAKAIWGILKKGGVFLGETLAEKANYIGECYAYGAEMYETDENIKKEIDEINQKIYAGDKEYKSIYDEGRKITLDAFEELYKILGTKFDEYYFESEMAPNGEKLVREFLDKGVFEESDGAIVFKAEKYNPKLHTRVFVTSKGLPTYETKEIGLTVKKFSDHNPDISIVDTATEQKDYMSVVTEAIRQMFPKEKYADRMVHVTHGMMRFASGKMSSRKGNVVTGESLIRDTVALIKEKMKDRDWVDEEKKNVSEIVGVSAIKYSILRSKVGGDIIYDFEKSISVDGDSGPYLQYALTRASSVLEKAKNQDIKSDFKNPSLSEISDFEKMLTRFPEITIRAWQEFEPHHIVTYLTELASLFNTFYAQGKIVDETDKNSPYKIALTESFSIVMNQGLFLLGIKIPDRM